MKPDMTNGVNGVVRSKYFYSIAGEKRKGQLEERNVPYCEPPDIPLWAQGYFFRKQQIFEN